MIPLRIKRPAVPRPAKPPGGTGGSRPFRLNPLKAWLLHHLYGLLSSLGQLSRTPLATLMTAAVIGIALALPTGLYVLLENALHISDDWDANVHLSLFLKTETAPEYAQQLAEQLRQRPDIASVRLITPVQALEEYRQLSGFNDALNALEENPLPTVLVVKPVLNSPQVSQELLKQLSQIPDVELAQYDMRWLERLFAIMQLLKRSVLILAVLLSLAVLLVVGNTIRLAIHNRRDEIEVNKLFGATDAFIRRPFLYTGIWHGLLGGVIAWILVKIAFTALQQPFRQLSALYHSQYQLVSMDLATSVVLLACGTLLGLGGAWLAVGRHLQAIQPR